ncbi:MAG: R3H domain-containing nucleic acid-binding protein [Patescibacteria group bacterium]
MHPPAHKERTDKVVGIIRDIVTKLGVPFDEVAVSEAAGHTLFTIRTKDSGVLIGARGEALQALNHLVKKMLEDTAHEDTDIFRFVVDVNGYHLKHIKMLEAQAAMLAERARTFKYDIEMSPMSAYDRLIVHAALTGTPDVKTESQGEGMVRHIVIKYIGAANTAPATEASPL